MRRAAPIVAGLLLVPPAVLPSAVAASPALSASGELTTSAGYDSDLFLDVVPDPSSPRYHSAAAWFGRVAPTLVGLLLLGDVRLELRYDGDVKVAAGHGLFALQEIWLAARLPELGRLRLRAVIGAGRFDPVRYSIDRFLSAGGDLRLAVRATDRLHGIVRYRLGLRHYPDLARGPRETDVTQLGEIGALLAPRPTQLVGITVQALALRSNQPGVELDRLRASVDGELAAGQRTTVFASAWAGLQSIAGSRADRQVGGLAGLRVRACEHVDVFGTFEGFDNLSVEPVADAQRYVAMMGVVGHATTRPLLVSRAAGAGDPASRRLDEQGDSPLVEAGRVRFRLRAPDASAVSVIGTWDDWSAGGVPLSRAEAGVWEVWAPLPRGRHRYHFLVDGRAVRPPGAPAYVADGFGSEDGVIEVLAP